MENFISRKELSEKLGLSLCTLWRMVRDGELPPPTRISARRVAWNAKTLEKVFDQREKEAAGQELK